MKKILPMLGIWLVWVSSTFAQFTVNAVLEGDQVKLDVTIPLKHYLYVDHFKVTDGKGNEQKAILLPKTGFVIDQITGHKKPVFNQSFKATYAWKPDAGGAGEFHVQYMGCDDQVCFMPQEKVVKLDAAAQKMPDKLVEKSAATDWESELENFTVLDSKVGYMKVDPFMIFLDQAQNGSTERLTGFRLFLSDPGAFVSESGLLLTIIFILLGGLALNLTPCVLPMVPINLAIIGAGAQAGSKGRGFALGGVYGLGIAIAYGLLGVVVVLTGSQFGTIQSNPWFNLLIAIIFIALALAMFDVFQIDLSRFQNKLGGSGEKKPGSFVVAFTMGVVAALLAGACVAPVVIAVLALATNVYEVNAMAGLALPFLLGLGMGLPWPFAGAGLSFLPKPGKWMVYVKYVFGVGIIGMAFYYGHLSYRAFRPAEISGHGGDKTHLVVDGTTNKGLSAALKQAHDEGKIVFVDFWASWCKNCIAMEKTTFKNSEVKAQMKDFVFIKYIAEDPTDPKTKAVMDYFGVQGMPTFVLLKAK